MAKPLKLRHVNEIAGTFVLAGIALLLVTVLMMGRAQRWFTGTRVITLQLPAEGAMGLKPGDDVKILGTVVGSIRNIRMDPDGTMWAQASVQSDFAGFVRLDSKAFIQSAALGVGEPQVEITKGGGAPLDGNQSLQLSVRREMEDTIEQVRAEAVPAIKELRAALEEYRQLAAGLRDPGGNLQQAIGNTNRIAASMERGDGLAAKVLSDPTLAGQVLGALPKLNASLDEAQAALGNLRKASDSLPGIATGADAEVKKLPALVEQTEHTLKQIEAVMRDLQATTASLPETAKSVNRTAESLPGLVIQMEETMRQTQRLVEGIQRNWLVRGSIAPDESGDRIRPDQINSGGHGGARP